MLHRLLGETTPLFHNLIRYVQKEEKVDRITQGSLSLSCRISNGILRRGESRTNNNQPSSKTTPRITLHDQLPTKPEQPATYARRRRRTYLHHNRIPTDSKFLKSLTQTETLEVVNRVQIRYSPALRIPREFQRIRDTGGSHTSLWPRLHPFIIESG